MPTTVILGGGLSGLSSAYYLAKTLPAAHKIVLLEKSSRFGGWVHTTQASGISFENGPRSVRPVGLQGLLTLQLIDELGLTPSLLTVSRSHPSAKNRFIYYNGQLNRAPSSLASAVSASFSGTSPFTGVIPAVLKEPFKQRNRTLDDESIDSFIARRFSRSFADNVLSALVHGIYAGDTRQLSMKAVFPSLWNLEQRKGSVVRGMLSGGSKPSQGDADAYKQLSQEYEPMVKRMKDVSVYSLEGGLERLPLSLVSFLEKHPNVEMRRECPTDAVSYDGTHFKIRTPSDEIQASKVVSALSSSALGTLLPLPHLQHNRSVTVGVVNLAFPSSFKLPVQGFGYLIPRSVNRKENPHQALGVVFDSDMFGSTDATKITVMMGGHYWDGQTIPSTEDLEAQAMETVRLHGLVPDGLEPLLTRATIQKDCIPQYAVGHPQRMRELHEYALSHFDGKLGLVGSSYGGVGMNDVVKSSWDLTRRWAAGQKATGLESFAA